MKKTITFNFLQKYSLLTRRNNLLNYWFLIDKLKIKSTIIYIINVSV